MPEKTKTTQPVRGISRFLYRLPIWLYRMGLGWMMGSRFILVEHTGRKSGLKRLVVIEVMRYDQASKTVIAASGYGEGSDWFRNLMAHPDARIHLGRLKMAVRARRLLAPEACQELVDYGHRHPTALKTLMKALHIPFEESEEGYQRISQTLPIIQFQPITTGKEGEG